MRFGTINDIVNRVVYHHIPSQYFSSIALLFPYVLCCVLCCMLYAACYMLYAICYMLYAICCAVLHNVHNNMSLLCDIRFPAQQHVSTSFFGGWCCMIRCMCSCNTLQCVLCIIDNYSFLSLFELQTVSSCHAWLGLII